MDRWIAKVVLRLSDELVVEYADDMPQLIYRAYSSLKPHRNKYLMDYNSIRGDLVCHYIDPPAEVGPTIRVSNYPTGDVSVWLATQIVGLTIEELGVLCGPFDKRDAVGTLLPVLRKAHRAMGQIRVDDQLIATFHKRRYLVLNYYLGAVYHEF